MKSGCDAPQNKRRRFLKTLWGFLATIAFVEFIWVGLSFFKPQKKAKAASSESLFVAGIVDDFAPGSVTAFARGRFYLSRLEDGGFLALSRKCTHLGCTVPWVKEENLFKCPCHSSVFDITGEVVKSPAPRPLDLHPVIIENMVIKVETGKIIRRDSFEPSQVEYAENR